MHFSHFDLLYLSITNYIMYSFFCPISVRPDQLWMFSPKVLDVEAFERLLGNCVEIMKRNITHYEEQLVRIFGSTQISDLR